MQKETAPSDADWKAFVPDAANSEAAGKVSSASIAGFADGESYWFRVRAIGEEGVVQDSVAYFVIPITMKAQVVVTEIENFRVVGVANQVVRLMWDEVPGVVDPAYDLATYANNNNFRNVKDGDDGEYLARGNVFAECFEIQYSTDSLNWIAIDLGGNNLRIQDGGRTLTSTSVYVSALTANTSYYFRMRVLETANNTGTDWTDPILVKTLAAAATRPGAPTNVSATPVSDNSIEVTWEESTAPDVVAYEVWYRTTAHDDIPAGIWKVETLFGTGNSTTVTGLEAGTEYEIAVRVQGATGNGNTADSLTNTSASVNATTTSS
jgi:hypothetical protein